MDTTTRWFLVEFFAQPHERIPHFEQIGAPDIEAARRGAQVTFGWMADFGKAINIISIHEMYVTA